MRTYILLLLTCLSTGCDTSAQQDFDCKTFLSKKVELSYDPNTVLKQFDNYRYCGLDSMDMKYFVNGPVIAPLIINMTSEKESITYEDVLKKILPFRKDAEYVKLKNAHNTLFARRDEVLTNSNWPELRTLIVDAYGYNPEQMHRVEDLYKENMQNKWTVGNLMNTFIAEEEKWPLKEQPKH